VMSGIDSSANAIDQVIKDLTEICKSGNSVWSQKNSFNWQTC